MTKKILCATDGEPYSDRAVVYAAEQAALLGVPLTICTVNLLSGGIHGPAVFSFREGEAEQLLRGAAAAAGRAGAKTVSTVELKGREVATTIIQHADQEGFDLIVTGTGDKHGLSRLMLGSVAADVVNRSHCTVVVVK